MLPLVLAPSSTTVTITTALLGMELGESTKSDGRRRDTHVSGNTDARRVRLRLAPDTIMHSGILTVGMHESIASLHCHM